MQQAIRWRRGRPATWQIVLARWLLALAVVLTIDPTWQTSFVVRAEDDEAAEEIVERAAVEDDEQPADVPVEGGAPSTPPRSAEERPPDALADDDLIPTDRGRADDGDADDPDVAPDDGLQPDVQAIRGASIPRRAYPPSFSCTADQGAAKAASFGQHDRLVMTYYYYWYDQASLDDPAMAQHPPPSPPLDWRSVSWHERQLADMASAGIDVALAVYWGDTSPWSIEALDPMIEARERLLAAGLRAPAIGLFFDTNLYATILPDQPELADLTTPDGLDMMAHQVGAFLDRVPPCHRARIDGRVLAFFWRADTEDGDHFTFDDRTFSGLNDLIVQQHGERLHYALEHSWLQTARDNDVELGAADIYRWGAALNGPRFMGRTVAIGPGYDDRNIEGRPGYTRERIDGATYSRDLRAAVMSGSTWLLLETWNELWEGTAIAETEETGRTYLGITARYTALFHQLAREQARDGWVDVGNGETGYLRRLADAPVEEGTRAEKARRWGARPFKEDDDGTGYFHFAIDRRLGLEGSRPLRVLVEYFDEGDGSFVLEYDSVDPSAPGDGAYTRTESVPFEDTRTWRVHRFDLADASLWSRQYDGIGDFRIHDIPGDDERLHVYGRVTVTAELGARPVPLGPESLSFVEPSGRQPVMLRWSEVDLAAGYVVEVQPFHVEGAQGHGFTLEERQRCAGAAEMRAGGQVARGLSEQLSCELRLARDLEDGAYRWRVQAIDAFGNARGDVSDWAYFIVARR